MTLATTARQEPGARPEGVVRLWRPGVVGYAEALAWQRARAAALAAGGEGEALALLQHPPVYTLGARGDDSHLLATPEALAAFGAEVVHTDRGGNVTFHGPGQLVAYPILDLRRRGLGVARYVRTLEAIMVDPRIPGVTAAPADRQSDFDFITSAEAAAIVAEEGIELITYADLQPFWQRGRTV